MIAGYPFNGRMDTDSPDTEFPMGSHRSALNVVFRGPQGKKRVETAPGTTLVPNSLLPSGTNLTICAKYDSVKQRLFIFNYNSNGNHGIYIYYTRTVAFVRLVQTGINTTGDPLAFLPYPRIYGVDILYGDAQSGDLLFFVDSLKRPRKLNIDRILNGGYSSIKDNFLKVIKAPPQMAPQVTYENDYIVTSNNLLNCLWQFAYTWVYDDFEESVLSTASIVPLTPIPFNPNQTAPVSQGSRIGIFLQTGDANVAKLRIYGRQTTTGGSSGWLIIDTLLKSNLGISDNGVYKYLFYGNGNYPAADPSFTALSFDYVPQAANDQALLDGTTISYGGIKEGYDYFNPLLSLNVANVNVPLFTVNGSLFFATPNGTPNQLTCYLTGMGSNDGFGNPTTLNYPPFVFHVRAKSNASDISFSYNNVGGTSIASLISSLETAATIAGWSVVSTFSNSFTISYPTGTMVFQSSYIQGITSGGSTYTVDQFAHLPQCAYQYGAIYFDADGRTNGVITNINGQITTPIQSTTPQIPQVTLSVAGYTPPSWAVYWRPVRTDNLTYNKFLQWVTDSAYSNSLAFATQQFAYFGLNNISYYNSIFSTSANVVSYQFTPGDRLKITGRYAVDGTFSPLNLDYAIINTVSNPIANGAIKTGALFLQIAYPAADLNPNFKLDGTDDFQNYQLTIYSKKAQNPTGTNVFFETGLTFGIGNPGGVSAYHMGNVGDNQVAITDADVFFRQRNVPLVNSYTLPTGSFTQGSPYSTMWILPGTEATPIANNSIYYIRGDVNKVAAIDNSGYPLYADNNQTFWNKSSFSLSVRLIYTLNVTDTTDPNGEFQGFIKVVDPSNNVTPYTVLSLQTGLVVHTQNTYPIDVTIPVPAGCKFWLVNFAKNQMFVQPSPIQLDVIRNQTINVFDYSFTDAFNIRTNADNRPSVQDTTALQTFFGTLYRYSEPDILGTNINNTNRFYPNNFDEFAKIYGDIVRLIVHGREMRVFQYRRCGHVGIYQKFIKNNTGTTTLVVADTIITPNNIQYFEGEFGIGNQPAGLSSSGFADYFPDPIKGYFCRLSLDGIVPISELNKVQTFAGDNLTNYLDTYNYQFGGLASVLGVYNVLPDRDSEAIFVLQGGVNGLKSIPAQSISFDERENAWQSTYSFGPDSIVCCENTLYSFSEGQLYIHNNTAQPCNYYGVQYPCSINPIYQEPTLQKKNFLALTQICSQPWESPLIYTNTISYGTQRQESNLVAEDYALLGADYNAPFWFDKWSQDGLIDGDLLSGNILSILFQITNPTVFAYLSNVSITYTENELVSK